MNIEENISSKIYSESEDLEDNDESSNITQVDLHNPFDMRVFWKNIDSYGFNINNEINTPLNVNHLIYLFAKEEKDKIQQDNRAAFPKNIVTISSKYLERQLEKDPNFIKDKIPYTKFYEEKNITPQKELKFLEKRAFLEEEKDNANLKKLASFPFNLAARQAEILNSGAKKKIGRPKKTEENSNDHIDIITKTLENYRNENIERNLLTLEDRLNILFEQIYELQLKQLAECICAVQEKKDKNMYRVFFDLDNQTTNIEISAADYKKFIKHRDPLNSISVYDLFQEKTHCYFNTDTKSKSFKDVEDIERGFQFDDKETKIKTRTVLHKNDRSRGSSKEKKRSGLRRNSCEHYHTGKKVHVEYLYCHHCKQRKPEELTLKCKSCNIGDGLCHKPSKTFTVNGCTVVRSHRSLIIKGFDSDPKDFIEASKELTKAHNCSRYFCHFCLKGNYDTLAENVKDKKDWLCPYCTGQCYCTRCMRLDKMLQLTAYYISLGGDTKDLYDELMNKDNILDKLFEHLYITRLYVIIYDKNSTPAQQIENMKNVGVDEDKIFEEKLEEMNNLKYAETELLLKKDIYELEFNKTFNEKFEIVHDKKLSNIAELMNIENKEPKLNKGYKYKKSYKHMLGKKRNYVNKNNISDKQAENYINKKINKNKPSSKKYIKNIGNIENLKTREQYNTLDLGKVKSIIKTTKIYPRGRPRKNDK